MGLSVEIVAPSELGPGERAAWTRFQAAEPALWSPYFSLGWLDAVAAERSDARVGVFLRDGAVVGFFPFQAASRLALLPLGGALSDYQGVVGAAEADIDLRQLVSAARAGRLDFAHLLAEQAASEGHLKTRHVSWTIDVSGGFEGYSAERRAAGSQVLKRIRQKKRAIARDCGAVETALFSRDPALFAQLIDWKRRQYARTGQPDVFAEPWTRRIVERAFASDDPEFGAALFALHAGGKLLAANLCLRSARVLHAWFIAHDAEECAHSPGLVLFGEILQALDGTGYAELDLGGGDYRFKQELATGTRALGAGFVGGRSLAAGFREAQYALRALFERLPLGVLSSLPGRAMRRIDQLRGLAGPSRRSR